MNIGEIYDNMLNEDKGNTYSYGCVMLYLNLNDKECKSIQEIIDEDDLYLGTKDDPGYGREDEPHVTLLYGLHNDVEDVKVESIIEKIKPLEVLLSKVDIFENERYDVLKFTISDEYLTEINSLLKELPHTTDYPKYNAHCTIAYLKKGKGPTYVKKFKDKFNLKVKGDKVVYSKSDGYKKNYKI